MEEEELEMAAVDELEEEEGRKESKTRSVQDARDGNTINYNNNVFERMQTDGPAASGWPPGIAG
jgi:hypothetical protein